MNGGDDIEPWYTREYSKIIYGCQKCEIQEVDDRVFYEDFYPNDIYRGSSGLHPEPRDWECPKHKDKHVWLLVEEIRREQGQILMMNHISEKIRLL